MNNKQLYLLCAVILFMVSNIFQSALLFGLALFFLTLWADGPAVPESREPASVVADASPTPADRLALAVCRGACPTGGPCPVEAICSDCRRDSAAVAHEIARQLRERYGSSTTADWLDGVGCRTPGARQTVREVAHD